MKNNNFKTKNSEEWHWFTFLKTSKSGLIEDNKHIISTSAFEGVQCIVLADVYE